jgi:hypothetical protein
VPKRAPPIVRNRRRPSSGPAGRPVGGDDLGYRAGRVLAVLLGHWRDEPTEFRADVAVNGGLVADVDQGLLQCAPVAWHP